MNRALYNAGVNAYALLVKAASPFNEKAALAIKGRKDLFSRIKKWRSKHQGPLVWVHAASLGEFEQGRPIIEELRKEFPHYIILLTFFSPSGYEIRKDYALADGVFYLPFDKPNYAKEWVSVVDPEIAIWVKYEYWANYFFELKKREVPIVLVSAIFRDGQRFFKTNNAFWKKVLQCVDHFFVQNESSAALLKSIGLNQFTIAGDTRFDRVVEIAEKATEIPLVASFVGNRKAVVIGSSYEAEETMIGAPESDWCWIIAPHEVNDARISALLAQWPGRTVAYSQVTSPSDADILVIDNIGMLSRIYQYSTITVIGGGFGKGIHNTLEAAVYGQPLLFGPKYEKFDEAKGLVAVGAAKSENSPQELSIALKSLKEEKIKREEAAKRAKDFVKQGCGAKNHILNFLKTRLKEGR